MAVCTWEGRLRLPTPSQLQSQHPGSHGKSTTESMGTQPGRALGERPGSPPFVGLFSPGHQAGLGGRCIPSPAFILRPAPNVLSSASDTPRSWRGWRTLGTECLPNELRPHPRRAGCLLLQALSISVTSMTHNELQFLREALGHSPKSRCSNSCRHPMLMGLHVNESRGSTFPRKRLPPFSAPFPGSGNVEACPQKTRMHAGSWDSPSGGGAGGAVFLAGTKEALLLL